jgi:hypothetical protein
VAAVIRRRRVEKRWLRSLALGASGVVVSFALVAGAAIGVSVAVQRLHSALPAGGAPQWSGVYGAAIACLSLALVAACYGAARRWASAEGAFLGAMLVLAVIALAVSAIMPGMSFVFAWPVFVAAAAALVASVAPRSIAFNAIPTAVSALVVVFMIVPTTYLMVCVALGLDAVGAAILAIFAAFAAWSLTPLLEAAIGGRPWVGSTALAAAALVLLVTGAATVRERSNRPSGATIVYALDADARRGWLAGSATSASARTWLERSLRSESSAQAGQAAPAWLTRSYNPRRITPAPIVALEPPTAVVVSDSLNRGGVRVVTLRVRAAAGSRSIAMAADAGVVLDAAVDGRRVERGRYRRSTPRWVLEYVDPPPDGFTLMLLLGPAPNPALALTARRAGLPTVSGISFPTRPPGILPIQDGDMTVVHKTVTF